MCRYHSAVRTDARFGATFAALFLLNLVLGLMVTVKGPVVPALLGHFCATKTDIGVMLALVTVGGAVSVLIGGWLTDALGPRTVFVLGLVLSCASFALFAVGRSMIIGHILMFFMGAGAGLIQGASNGFVLALRGQRALALINISQFFFGIGAILGPLLAGLLLRHGYAWQTSFEVTAFSVAMCAPLLLAFRRAPSSPECKPPLSLLRCPAFLFFGLVGMVYITLELGISEWIASLLIGYFGMDAGFAASWSSLFWGGIAAGRFGTGVYLSHVEPRRLLFGAACAVPPSLVVLITTSSKTLALVAIALCGLALAPIFPTLLGMTGAAARRNEGGAAGIVVAISVLGASVLRPLMAALASRTSLVTGFTFFLALSLFMCVMTFRAGRQKIQKHGGSK
jgi:fucose permease